MTPRDRNRKLRSNMKWSNVKLIFSREVRDQLRDRRSVFMIAVLPLLLYPLLGMSFVQVAQFLKEHPTRVWIIGAERLPDDPALIEEKKFSAEFCSESEHRLIDLTIDHDEESTERRGEGNWDERKLANYAKSAIYNGKFDTVVFFPPEFADKLAEFRESLENRDVDPSAIPVEASVPQPVVFVNKASDKSRIAQVRVNDILARWHDAIVQRNLEASHVPITATRPFKVVDSDVAEPTSRRAAVWSKILPFVVLIWALTGAFYPAVDLCAGEKERGTLETLLSSPAQRVEIVWGKLFTIMTFSAVTSLLNMACMGLTGWFIIQQFDQVGGVRPLPISPPPLASMGWLVLALIPISALFSALSLAVASFAKSTKEGQYYLMPLLLISLPLMMLPMLPAAQLDLGMSIIPVTGMMFLLRMLIEGQYTDALRFCVPVLGVTLVCCWLAIRWAVSQFQNESVLFRENERWDIGLWVRHVVRDRADTPRFHDAIMCGVLLLMIRFFAGMMPAPEGFVGFATSTLTLQIAMILTPALLMTIILGRKPAKTLSLRMPKLSVIPAAILLAVALHPCSSLIAHAVRTIYPFTESAREQLTAMTAMLSQENVFAVLAVMAVTPAICEELAFRGFILSGLRDGTSKWTAIVISSLFFGMVHMILQQSIPAFIVGLVIGYIVIQSGSILTGILFHATYNSLALLPLFMTPEVFSYVYQGTSDSLMYHWQLMAIGGMLGIGLLWWFNRLPVEKKRDDRCDTAFDPASVGAATK